jgi:hypothetical protein
VKKTKATRPVRESKPGELITIEPAKRFQLRVIATLKGRGKPEENLCAAPDHSARYFMRDGYGTRRLSLARVLRWLCDALCSEFNSVGQQNDSDLEFDPAALRDCLCWIAGIVHDNGELHEARCIEKGVLPPAERWAPPEPNTVQREVHLFAPVVEEMERQCAKHNIPINQFIEAALSTQCGAMDDPGIVEYVRKDWPAEKAHQIEARSSAKRASR